MTDREELERRLLALVRDYLDESDEAHPEGYEIEDFMVLYHVRYAPTDGADLNPWDGGSRPGWSLGIDFSSTTRTYLHDEALLAEALHRTQTQRWERQQERMAEEMDASDEDASGEEPRG
jgi:hypothetical protein